MPRAATCLQVEDLAFEENSLQQPVSMLSRTLTAAEGSPVLVKYAALLVGILVVMAFGVRPALRHARSASAQIKAGVRELPSRAETAEPRILRPAEPVEVDPERLRAQEIYEQVTTQLKREPSQSSRLLQSWIHSD